MKFQKLRQDPYMIFKAPHLGWFKVNILKLRDAIEKKTGELKPWFNQSDKHAEEMFNIAHENGLLEDYDHADPNIMKVLQNGK